MIGAVRNCASHCSMGVVPFPCCHSRTLRRVKVVIAGHSALKTRVNALMTPQVGLARLAAVNGAELGQARVPVQSIIFVRFSCKEDGWPNKRPCALLSFPREHIRAKLKVVSALAHFEGPSRTSPEARDVPGRDIAIR